MILLIDNLDSFTYNLADYLMQSGAEVEVVKNTENPEKVLSDPGKYKGVVISPGPGKPEHAGFLTSYLNLFILKKPILGICLGNQAIGQYFGAELIKANKPMHGKISQIICEKDPIFSNIPEKIKVVRYHSLILTKLPNQLVPIAKCGEEIMAIRHTSLPIYGLQFHPEAVKTDFGMEILKNWLLTIKQQIQYS
ncbi:MAG: anthranilate synthase component II [Cytophagaceae bacterium]